MKSNPSSSTAAALVSPVFAVKNRITTIRDNKKGVIKFIGPTQFADGVWVGIE